MKIQDGGSSAIRTAETSTTANAAARAQQTAPERGAGKEQTKVAAEVSGSPDFETLQKAVEALNKAVEVSLPNRLEFRVHEATKQLQVQVVDPESEKVIKEIPPQEILDLMARIKEMVGWFLDERI